MAERAQFPPVPIKSKIAAADGTAALQWLAWFGALALWIQRTRVYVFSVDVPSIPVSAGWWAQFATPGAQVGDFALAGFDPAHVDLAVTAQVTAADTTSIWIRNWGAGAVDLAAGTVRIRIERAR